MLERWRLLFVLVKAIPPWGHGLVRDARTRAKVSSCSVPGPIQEARQSRACSLEQEKLQHPASSGSPVDWRGSTGEARFPKTESCKCRVCHPAWGAEGRGLGRHGSRPATSNGRLSRQGGNIRACRVQAQQYGGEWRIDVTCSIVEGC